MSEFVLMAILHSAKRVALFAEQQKQKVWKQCAVLGLQGKELLIFGYGGIAKNVAKRAAAF